MSDNKVVNAKTTEKTLRLDDKLLKKISDKAYSLRLGSDQALMRKILEEYFVIEEEIKMEKKYSPSVTLTYSSEDYLKKVAKMALKRNSSINDDDYSDCFKEIVQDGLDMEVTVGELKKSNQSLTTKVYDLESKLKLEQIDKQYWKDRVLGKPQEPTKPSKKTKK